MCLDVFGRFVLHSTCSLRCHEEAANSPHVILTEGETNRRGAECIS